MNSNTPFTDPAMVGRYVKDTPQRVPGFADLHRMALILLSEYAPTKADILVLGAGGGLELKSFAEDRPDWSFTGVDPSQPMLELAQQVMGPLGSKVQWVHGYIVDAPQKQFDGATCFLTFHFLPSEQRLEVLRELKLRLKPGAPLIVAHHSKPQSDKEERWLARSVVFAAGNEADLTQAATSASFMAQNLSLLSADEEEALLREAGFSEPMLFYAGFSFRGWVAFAGEA